MQYDSSQHPVDYLFSQLAKFGSYPDGVQAVAERIQGLAFFPGGAGLRNAQIGFPLPPMPIGGVMVLGHIFDTVARYTVSVADNSENENSPTWGPLLELLAKSHIMAARCFFTNAYMGLKINSDMPMGKFFGALPLEYVERCSSFLLKQIQVQQPRLLLALGKDVWQVLTPLANELNVWSGITGFSQLDKRKVAMVTAQITDVPHPTVVVALTQPTRPFHATNVKTREYTAKGDTAEIAMILDGCKACGLVQ